MFFHWVNISASQGQCHDMFNFKRKNEVVEKMHLYRCRRQAQQAVLPSAGRARKMKKTTFLNKN